MGKRPSLGLLPVHLFLCAQKGPIFLKETSPCRSTSTTVKNAAMTSNTW
jgi:hypothetical protein